MSARLQTLLLTVLLAAAPSIQAQPTRQELQTAIDAINRDLPANRGGPTTIYKASLENDQIVFDSTIDLAKLRPLPPTASLRQVLQDNFSNDNIIPLFACNSPESRQLNDSVAFTMRIRLSDTPSDIMTFTVPKGYCAAHPARPGSPEDNYLTMVSNLANSLQSQLPIKVSNAITITQIHFDAAKRTLHRHIIVTDPEFPGKSLSAIRTRLQQHTENTFCASPSFARGNSHYAFHEHFTFANRPDSVDVVIPKGFCANRR